ncbi:MAG: alpha/beta fold hydrolase [Neisseriaceae bacterium]|nr:alpha/beta fold hydrolase [Neisseriaceae bacterium]
MLRANNIVWVDGPVGRLETIYIPAQGQAQGVAVLNHPNPTQGGTNTNKVIQTAAKALSKLGYHCYLPNLRGVGQSDGEHNYGQGEVDDALAVVAYAKAAHPEAQHKLAIAGFSFGGFVASQLVHRVHADKLLLIGPAVATYKIHSPNVPSVEDTLIIHGEIDDVVPLTMVTAWAKPQNLPIVIIPQAGHFFHGQLILLGKTIERYFEH